MLEDENWNNSVGTHSVFTQTLLTCVCVCVCAILSRVGGPPVLHDDTCLFIWTAFLTLSSQHTISQLLLIPKMVLK